MLYTHLLLRILYQKYIQPNYPLFWSLLLLILSSRKVTDVEKVGCMLKAEQLDSEILNNSVNNI